MSSDVEEASIQALEGSALQTLQKPMISRTLSPSGKKISSLPVTPIAQSNLESEHGGNMAFPAVHVVSGIATFTIGYIVMIRFNYLK